ncbi:Anti-sigma-K factor rskA [uncultured archaeon]|nr:Anti-sigma-K factor rskA [uncultured archaeon]
MSKLAISILIVLVLACAAFALPTWWVYDTNIDSYSGQIARDRRVFDPYSRDRYFGSDYQRDFSNFGTKGPTDRLTKTGAKSAFSSVFNLDVNAFIPRGRDPSAISNWDPNMRGYPIIDVSADMLPYGALQQVIGPNDVMAKGAARLVSLGDEYGAGLTKALPSTQVFVQANNLPPLDETEVYEVWLFNSEREYPLSVGLMKVGIDHTGQLIFEMRRRADQFDAVMITKEPFPDSDPRPSDIILWGYFGQIRDTLNPSGSDFNQRLR